MQPKASSPARWRGKHQDDLDDMLVIHLLPTGVRLVCGPPILQAPFGTEIRIGRLPNANRLTVGIMAMVAEEERRMISARTKAALAAAKARGKKIGGFRGVKLSPKAQRAGLATRQAAATARARELAPLLAELQAAGVDSLNGVARALTEREIPTPRGSTTWSPSQVSRLLASAR
jgi:DNA invertase Pin-like site-specific DNA recombinase